MRQHQHLVAEVEAGRGFVHDNGGRLLRQGARNERELALPAADPRVLGLGQLGGDVGAARREYGYDGG